MYSNNSLTLANDKHFGLVHELQWAGGRNNNAQKEEKHAEPSIPSPFL
jgi:hypothetical protein